VTTRLDLKGTCSRALRMAIAAAFLLSIGGELNAATLWNNGTVDMLTNTGRQDCGVGACAVSGGNSWTVFDNFTVPAGPGWSVTGFDISDWFLNGTPTANYKNTSWSLWLGDPLAGGTLVASGTNTGVLANINGNCSFMCLESISVTFNGAVNLGSGTYYLGSTNLLTASTDLTNRAAAAGNGLPGWEQSNGTHNGVPGSTWNTTGATSFTFPSGGTQMPDTAFNINGTLVPEPGTIVLLSMALAGFGFLRRRMA